MTKTSTTGRIAFYLMLGAAALPIISVALNPVPAIAAAPVMTKASVRAMLQEVADANGIDPDTFDTIAKIESGYRPDAFNPSGAKGLFQFMPSTAKQYSLDKPFDARANAEAAAELMQNNRTAFVKKLHREPTGGELYLMHQQGVGGAIKLLRNPSALAIDVVGKQAVKQNGGRIDMTAGEFAALWTSRFDK